MSADMCLDICRYQMVSDHVKSLREVNRHWQRAEWGTGLYYVQGGGNSNGRHVDVGWVKEEVRLLLDA